MKISITATVWDDDQLSPLPQMLAASETVYAGATHAGAVVFTMEDTDPQDTITRILASFQNAPGMLTCSEMAVTTAV